MSTLTKVSSTPTSVVLRDPENLSKVLKVDSSYRPVRRRDGEYNHIKKIYKISDVVKVPGVCRDACMTAPVVVTVSLSAPEGIDLEDYWAAILAAYTAYNKSRVFLGSADSIEVSV